DCRRCSQSRAGDASLHQPLTLPSRRFRHAPVTSQGGTMAEHGMMITSPSRNANAEPGSGGRGDVPQLLLISGILAATLYVAMMVAIRYEGYSPISQTLS